MKFNGFLLAVAAWLAFSLGPAHAQNVLPAIQGPNGPVMADPIVQIGYDTGTGKPCVVGSTVTCPGSGGGGGGGGAVTVANGANVVEGAIGDNPWSGTGNGTLDALLKAIAVQALSGSAQLVNIQLNGAVPSLTNPIFTANAEAADVTGTFTNATQTGNVQNNNADGYAAGLISIHGTYGTASASFFVSDDGGTTLYPVICSRSDGTASETGYSSLTNVSREWACPVGGNDTLEVLSTAVASGTVNVRVGISAPPPSSTTGTISQVASNTGGSTPISKSVPANTTSVAICTSACTLYGLYVQTISATPLWLKLYNTAQGSVTCGTPTPVDRILIPASATGAGAVIPIAGGVGAAYGTALTACVTTGIADNDTGAPTVSQSQISYYVK